MTAPLLSVEEIHAYYGEAHILQGVSLTVGEGETVTLIGRNGAGKTTTLRSIMGIVRPRRGRIVLRGEDVTGADAIRSGLLVEPLPLDAVYGPMGL